MQLNAESTGEKASQRKHGVEILAWSLGNRNYKFQFVTAWTFTAWTFTAWTFTAWTFMA
jgi:hypothetical protein